MLGNITAYAQPVQTAQEGEDMCQENKKEEKNIIEFFNRKTFVKVKPAFQISKILFSFVEMDDSTKRVVTAIDCYMKIEDAALLARKITTARMYRLLEKERAKGQQYPNNVWQSVYGGVSEAEAKKRHMRSDGRAVSRYFAIAPGASKYAVMTCTTCAGDTNAQGLIVPDMQDKDKKVIRVALASHDEIEKLGIMLEATVNAYTNYICNIYNK